jgi:hypothetical protein
MGLWQGIWQTKVIAGINRTDKRPIVPICSKLKHKSLRFQCAVLPILIASLLALGLRHPGTVLAKYVVQRSLMLKQKETVDFDEVLRGWSGIAYLDRCHRCITKRETGRNKKYGAPRKI